MHAPDSAKYLEVKGGKIAYDVAGPVNGHSIILIHEAIADRRMWNRELRNLAKHYRVLRFDLRGYGSSSPAEKEFSYVDDLNALIEHLDIKRPLLVGASIGGRIAIDFVVAHPGIVRGLLLISPGFSGMDYPMFPEGVFEVDEKASKAAYDAYAIGNFDAAFEHLRGLWGAALEGKNLQLFRTMVYDNASEVFQERSEQHELPVGTKAATQLAKLNVPLLVLVGDKDNPAMPHVARYLADHVPHAKMKLVPGADHLLNLTAPRAFDEAVEEMMNVP